LFDIVNNTTQGNTFDGIFSPSNALTDAMGIVRTRFVPNASCPANCGLGQPCQGEIIAMTPGGQSVPLQLTINIP
jgi:hypothetical protein